MGHGTPGWNDVRMGLLDGTMRQDPVTSSTNQVPAALSDAASVLVYRACTHKSCLPPQALSVSAVGGRADIPDPRSNVR